MMNIIWRFVLLLTLTNMNIIHGGLQPALTVSSRNQWTDFLPPLYNPSESFSEDIYIQIYNAPGHSVGLIHTPGSYGIQINGDLSLNSVCYSSSAFKKVENMGRTLSTRNWHHICLVYNKGVGMIYYLNGSEIFSSSCVPPLASYSTSKSLVEHFDSYDTVDGIFYFRNYRHWKTALSGSKVNSLRNVAVLAGGDLNNLLMWLPLDDDSPDAEYPSLLDWGPHGMHARAHLGIIFTDVETDLLEYKPYSYVLKPTTDNVQFNITDLPTNNMFLITFWVKIGVYSSGANILSGALDTTNCRMDTKICLQAATTLRFYHYTYASSSTADMTISAVGTWTYIYLRRDGANSGLCQSKTPTLGGKGSYPCTTQYPYFCNSLIFYNSAANPSFKHFQWFNYNYDATIINQLAFTKYVIYVMYILI